MSNKLTEQEIRFKIEQALSLAPRLTIGMLQSFLPSRVPYNARDVVLAKMQKEGLLRISTQTAANFKGRATTFRVVTKVSVTTARAVKAAASSASS